MPEAGKLRTPSPRVPAAPYALAVIACLATTAVAAPLSRDLDLANVVMLYPLTVMLIAVRLGRGPSILAAFLNVALFDFFLVPPYYTFAVADVQYLLTFAVMLAVALVTGHLTADLSQQAQAAARREQDVRVLHEVARGLAVADTLGGVAQAVRLPLSRAVRASVAMLVTDARGELVPADNAQGDATADLAMARMALGGPGFTDLDAPRRVRYEPLSTPEGDYGVLAFVLWDEDAFLLAERVALFEAVASLAAIALERAQRPSAAGIR